MPHVWICRSRPQGLRRWSQRNPSSIWSCWSWSWRWLSWENPSSLSGEGDLLVILIKITTPWWFTPGSWLRIAGECVQLMMCNLLMEILHELPQFLVCVVSKLCLEALWSTPTPVRVTSWCISVILLLWRQRLQCRGVTSPYSDVHPYLRLHRS